MIINMTSGGMVPGRILDAQTITPTTENQVIEEDTYLRGALTVLGDSDLLPENILKGKNIFGIDGVYDPATADPDLIPENIRKDVDIFGVTGTMTEKEVIGKSGTYTVTSTSGSLQSLSIPHGIGKTPNYFGIKNIFLRCSYGTAGLDDVTADAKYINIETDAATYIDTDYGQRIEWNAVYIGS